MLNLATEIRGSGVDVILDKWDLKEGHDAIAFMEKMVTDPDVKKVIMVCDREYAQKADKRSGGVGTEAQIISPRIYQEVEQDKFVAVITERDDLGQAYIPVHYHGRIYIDLSDGDLYASNFEQLLRWIYDKPLHVKPRIGDRPAFLSEEGAISLGTTASFNRAHDAIRNSKSYASGALDEYFDTLINNLEEFRIEKTPEKEFDDQVITNIERFLPYRNEVIQLFICISQYNDSDKMHTKVHRFFERLIPYLDRPESMSQWQQWDFDNFKFIIQELFIYLIAVLARHERFEFLGHMLGQQYYVAHTAHAGRARMVNFSIFRNHLDSLTHRNSRINARRLSMHADLLNKRSERSGVSFDQLMQGDLLLFIRNCLDVLGEGGMRDWWPETLLYSERHYGPIEIFARAESRAYFDTMKVIFDIESIDELKAIFGAFREGKLHRPMWQFTQPDLVQLTNLERLGMRP